MHNDDYIRERLDLLEKHALNGNTGNGDQWDDLRTQMADLTARLTSLEIHSRATGEEARSMAAASQSLEDTAESLEETAESLEEATLENGSAPVVAASQSPDLPAEPIEEGTNPGPEEVTAEEPAIEPTRSPSLWERILGGR